MIKFDLSKEEFDKLNFLVKTCQSVANTSIKDDHYSYHIYDDKMVISIYGNGNIIQYSVAVANVISDSDDERYFNINILDMIKSFEKVYKSSKQVVATATVENGSKFYVTSGKSNIIINIMDVMPLEDIKESDNSFDLKNQIFFNEESDDEFNNVLITEDVINFMSVASKSINLIGTDNVSGIELENNRIKFSDDILSVSDIETEKQMTKKDYQAFISSSHFEILQSLYKIVNEFNIIYTKENNFIKIDLPLINFKAIMAQPQIICSYPNNDDLKNLKPNDEDCFEWTVNSNELIEKLDMFDGIFPSSQWRFKTVNFTINKNNELNLYYSNFNAEVDTDINITDFKTNSSIDEYTFKVPTIILRDYLIKCLKEPTFIKIKVSGYDPDPSVPNSLGILIKVGNIELTLIKLLQEESY